MTLLAGWAAVLSRLSGQDDVVIGSPVAGRNRREIEGLIGFFVNTLAMRVDLEQSATVAELLARREGAGPRGAGARRPAVRAGGGGGAAAAQPRAHADLPGDVLVAEHATGGQLSLPGLEPSNASARTERRSSI